MKLIKLFIIKKLMNIKINIVININKNNSDK